MKKISKNEEIEKFKHVLMQKIKSENDSQYSNLSSDEIMKIVIDSSNKGKYVFWVLREYLKGNIKKFEDIESRVKQALRLFKNNLFKFSEQQKQLNKISFQELEKLVSPYQDVLTQNAIKRMNKERIWAEIDTIYSGPEGKVYVPKTEQASIFLGQGTKWCTAATGSTNMFDYYNKNGPLYVFVLSEKDEQGREIKYQLHFETNQFMDTEDTSIDISMFNNETNLINKLSDNLSLKQKIKHLLGNINNVNNKFVSSLNISDDLIHQIFAEKIKISDILNSIPLKYITKELCEIAVKQNGLALIHVLEEYKTKKLYEIAVKQNGWAIRYVPDEFRTQELCEMAVEQNGGALKYVPLQLITQELCETVVKKNGLDLEYILDKFKTKELCELAVNQNGHALYFVPKDLKTKELCEFAARQNGNSLYYVPNEFKTKELCKIAVKQSGLSLHHVPKELKTPELCKIAIQQNGSALSYVPSEYKTKELYEIAVKQNGLALRYVPNEFKTKKLCEIAVKQNGLALEFIPYEYETKNLYEIAVKQNGLALQHILNEFKTKELCEIAVKQNVHALSYVPEENRTCELCETVIKQNGMSLAYIKDKKLKDELTKKYIMEKNTENNLNYSFNEVIKLIFSFEENKVKNLFKDIKELLKPYFIEIKSEELYNMHNSNTLSFS